MRENYWEGFATGAIVGGAAAAAALWVAKAATRNRDPRILRLEDSIQIARSVEEVFSAWADFAGLPDHIPAIRHVQVQGDHSIWTVHAAGKDSRWEAETVQFIPNEAIGWKSVSGPQHSGRINFSPLGDQTIVHVAMNYAPPLGRFSLLAAPTTPAIGAVINQALRDFKASLEGRSSGSQSPARAGWRSTAKDVASAADTRKQPGAVDYTRPPKAQYS